MAGLAVIACAATATAGLVWSGGRTTGAGPAVAADRAAAGKAARLAPGPNDPLSADERRRAMEIAGDADTRRRGGRTALLYVQRDDDKAATGRRAEAFSYDYDADRLTLRTIDLGSGRIVATETATGVQPPPSDDEERAAAELLLADAELGKGVREEFEKRAGRPLRSPDDLHLRGVIFMPQHVHGVSNARAVASCAEHRCLRLFVRLPKGKWLDTSRIVIDLSAREIYTMEW
ncbi:hypothetical protein DP939_14205 [Spongiactinospora rosea]|uniref:Tat pathway signal sequence domain protein n=1 Tax=Spongiactinospora rosea TaxID=2248750 RepID=A0A366M2N9_9ACTN|nr:hypothetical protein [Spongiactinospora rosea]RBQ19854.1 hypothetical protein DP939_14205 [Spongiactinospora rosea]